MGSDAGDFEIERRTPGGLLMATSLEHGGQRTFTLLCQAIAGDRMHFHLEGRHAQPATDGKASISTREPDFSALPARDRDLARHRYEAIRPLIGKAERTSADVRQRAEAVAQADPNKRRKKAGSSVSARTKWTWLRWSLPPKYTGGAIGRAMVALLSSSGRVICGVPELFQRGRSASVRDSRRGDLPVHLG
jgi:hypothetical protein